MRLGQTVEPSFCRTGTDGDCDVAVRLRLKMDILAVAQLSDEAGEVKLLSV